MVHKKLRLNELVKFWFYFTKLIACKSEAIGYYSERLSEPQEIHWKYIGESSTVKQMARIKTSIIGIGIAILVFMAFYFPMLKVDQEKIFDPILGTLLGILISVVILIMVIIFRGFVQSLMPTRRPSSKLS